MSLQPCHVKNVTIGSTDPLTPAPLVLIAGPCVLEDEATNHLIASTLVALCDELDMPLIFKASFDKANRSSGRSRRGPGLDAGLGMLGRLRAEFDVPVTTDVHEPAQAAAVAETVDLLQIPAFLCRQTDLLQACGATGRAVNVKKGQFMSPAEMRHAIGKLQEVGAQNLLLTERGTFFGYNRLVNDFTGLGDLMELGPPVCFDVTHSTQLPGAGADVTAGRPERASLLARAAVAAGVDAVFIECHPDPSRALSDGSTQQPLTALPGLLRTVQRVRAAVADAGIATR
ncbi:MAG: 3-deoxy-8-phosphooctulonate synthase [Phycisphaerales bacterium]|nr:3-deoxy-8-phosphooctulonate synthase [Phycisphaerae bacterium]NNF44992.1 3-deoxy-8-phosphooctulonate synthase [Phycisphaerales bacterium]NNM26763.1 3-deoxy-8-phosphooctulonate synthase [Phycisphaerales bacterium]